MSGPKTDYFDVADYVALELERKRQERLKAIRRALDEYSLVVADGEIAISKIKSFMQHELNQLSDDDNVRQDISEITNLKKEYISSLTSDISAKSHGEAEDIIEAAEALTTRIHNTWQRFEEIAGNKEKTLRDYIAFSKSLNDSSEFLATLPEKAIEVGDFTGYDNTSPPKNIAAESELDKLANTLIDDIDKLLNMNILNDRAKATFTEMQETVKASVGSDISFERKKRRIEQCRTTFLQIQERVMSEAKQKSSSYRRYEEACREQGVIPKEIQDFNSLSQLKKELHHMTVRAQDAMKREHILKQLDVVMKKHHATNITDSVILSKIENGENRVYGFADRDNAAINVFISKGNEITISVEPIGDDSAISEEEKELILKEQYDFCDLHPTIIKDLEARGVISKKEIERKAPGIEHCNKIQRKNRAASNKSKRGKGKNLKAAARKV